MPAAAAMTSGRDTEPDQPTSPSCLSSASTEVITAANEALGVEPVLENDVAESLEPADATATLSRGMSGPVVLVNPPVVPRDRRVIEHHYYNRTAPHPGHRLRIPQGDMPAVDNVEPISGFPTSWTAFQAQINRVWDGLVQVASEPALASVAKVPAVRAVPLGFSFSPAGLLLPYHLGVAACLVDLGVLSPDVPIAGASAGALAAIVVACNVPVDLVMQTMYRVEQNLRKFGAARRLHMLLDKELESLLPPNAPDVISERPGRTTIAYTHVWPLPRGQFVSQFTTVDDIRECLAASCNIPFYFAKWPTVTCRGQACVDGYFASRRNFGCPRTSAARDVRVLPFTPTSVRMTFPEGNCISPELAQYDVFLDYATNGKFTQDLLEYLRDRPAPHAAENSDDADALQRSIVENELDDIESRVLEQEGNEAVQTPEPEMAPKRLAEMWGIQETGPVVPESVSTVVPVLKHSVHQLLRMALDATTDETIRELYDIGRADAYRWVQLERYGYQTIVPKTAEVPRDVSIRYAAQHHRKIVRARGMYASHRRLKRWFSYKTTQHTAAATTVQTPPAGDGDPPPDAPSGSSSLTPPP